MKKIFLLVAFLSFASVASAQSATATWNQSEVVATAQSFTYTLKVDTAAATTLTATCTAAVSPATGSVCTAPFTLANPTQSHTYVLTASNATGSAALTISGGVPGTSGFKVVVTVTVP